MGPSNLKKTFQLVMVKPSHYDRDGYVIQWHKSSIPSNTMAVIYGLAMDCAERKVLGEETEIVLTSYDETNTRIKVKEIAKTIKNSGDLGIVTLVGVQTNQFPRAIDLARQFIQEGVLVSLGGFHVSGCISMLKELPYDIKEAMDMGVSIFAGELEGHLEELLNDAVSGKLKQLYNFMANLPALEGTPVPFLPVKLIERMSGLRTAFDAGRGCPFSCSFCTIINVQGRTSRYRNADDVEEIIRANVAQGINSFFITDDNFSRNRDWESIYDRIIKLREEEGFEITFSIQVDTVCHKIPRFIEKSGRAGVNRAFIGMESINPESLIAAQKKQNNIAEYRNLLQAWHRVGVLTFAGYILGFPSDTPESILRDIRIIQKELPVDLLEFFILTPLPGSQDHKELVEKGVVLESDMNKYDTTYVTAPHAKMTAKEWQDIYNRAWEEYYSYEHVERIIRRAKKWGYKTRKMMWMTLEFYACATIEKIHPLDGGIFRKKYRKDRRYGMPIENPVSFYLKYGWEILSKHVKFLKVYLNYRKIHARAMNDQIKVHERDIAMEPFNKAELNELELYKTTEAARAVAEKARA